jgi:hypothetical protein
MPLFKITDISEMSSNENISGTSCCRAPGRRGEWLRTCGRTVFSRDEEIAEKGQGKMYTLPCD